MRNRALKCADCGKVVPIADIDNGATHRQVDPSEGLWETLCKTCTIHVRVFAALGLAR